MPQHTEKERRKIMEPAQSPEEMSERRHMDIAKASARKKGRNIRDRDVPPRQVRRRNINLRKPSR